MTIMARRSSGRRASAAFCLGAAAVLLSGCGTGSPSTSPQPALTVTVTPTITVTPARSRPTAAATSSRRVKSDVVGRKFDLGTIVGVKRQGGVSVIILDRWTAQGVSDSRLAANGIRLPVHSDPRFENLNSNVTYRIPVAPGAVFTHVRCVDVSQPALRERSSLRDFTRLQHPEKIVLLALDPQGRAVRVRNDPAC
jgi:hypothetical protein